MRHVTRRRMMRTSLHRLTTWAVGMAMFAGLGCGDDRGKSPPDGGGGSGGVGGSGGRGGSGGAGGRGGGGGAGGAGRAVGAGARGRARGQGGHAAAGRRRPRRRWVGGLVASG